LYFPYFYGRQGECRALEDIAPLLGNPQKVFPVIEPVVESPKDLVRALDLFKSSNQEIYLIINPSKYKLESASAAQRWNASFASYIADVSLTRPTLEIRSTTSLAHLTAFFAAYAGRQTGVSIRTSHILATDVSAASSGQNVLFFLHGSADPSGYSSILGSANCVEVRDSFRSEARNADYLGEEKFTSENLLFRGQSRIGFSDYTLLPGKFNASGGPLGAAVIHMSFVDAADGSIRVEHFVSDEVRQHFGSQPSKMMEAMTKLDAVVAETPAKFSATPGRTAYARQFGTRAPTSPTYNKRQQIAHHVDTIRQVV
jgi:hypothetical protein